MARRLRGHVGLPAIGPHGDGVRLGHRHGGGHGMGRGVDEGHAVVAVDGHQHPAAIGRGGQALRALADLDGVRHAVGRGVDLAHRRGAGTADEHALAVRGDHDAVGPAATGTVASTRSLPVSITLSVLSLKLPT